MDHYIGPDTPLKEISISVRRDGKRIWRGMGAGRPRLRQMAPDNFREKARFLQRDHMSGVDIGARAIGDCAANYI